MSANTQTPAPDKAKAALAALDEQFAYFTPEAPVSRPKTIRPEDAPGAPAYHSGK